MEVACGFNVSFELLRERADHLEVLNVALNSEYRDTALRNERDIWDFTQLPTLAVIAWSGGIADLKPARTARLKRLFSKKPPKDLLADAPG